MEYTGELGSQILQALANLWLWAVGKVLRICDPKNFCPFKGIFPLPCWLNSQSLSLVS